MPQCKAMLEGRSRSGDTPIEGNGKGMLWGFAEGRLGRRTTFEM